ncbi:AMED_5909 family protein [Amycolatopsis sp. NPDC001319]|uniref:AMED_5909 family protein n=1 Tax=unclassified Amycolatopsis TaxID=2618356 RepID=UPI0036AA9750
MTTMAEPTTLLEAHDVANARRPAPGANASAWLAFHQANARMYRAVAGVDRWHHHEANYWAGFEERQATAVSERMQEDKTERR